MAIPGETIATGGAATCPDCGVTPKLGVYSSAAGSYIGTYCKCGPFSRESEYFKNGALAQAELDRWNAGAAQDAARTTEFDSEGAKLLEAIELDPRTLRPLDEVDG